MGDQPAPPQPKFRLVQGRPLGESRAPAAAPGLQQANTSNNVSQEFIPPQPAQMLDMKLIQRPDVSKQESFQYAGPSAPGPPPQINTQPQHQGPSQMNLQPQPQGPPQMNVQPQHQGPPQMNVQPQHQGPPQMNVPPLHQGPPQMNLQSQHQGPPQMNVQTQLHRPPPQMNVQHQGPPTHLQHQQAPASISQSQFQQQTAPPQPSQDPVVKSVKLFQTILRNKDEEVRPKVVSYISGVINGSLEPEEFTKLLQEALNSKAQPHLLSFLRDTLPVLREAINNGHVIYRVEGDMATIEFARSQMNMAPSMNMTQQINVPTTNSSSFQSASSTSMGNSNGPSAPSFNSQPSFQPMIQQNQKLGPVHSQSSELMRPEAMDTDESSINPNDIKRPLSAMQASAAPMEENPPAPAAAPSEEETVRTYKESPFVNALIKPEQIMTRITQRMNAPCYVDEELLTLVSDSVEYRLRELIAELGVMAQHRMDPNPRMNPDYFVLDDAKAQIKWLETMDKQLEDQRSLREKEETLRTGKSKSSLAKDTIERAKDIQRAEAEAKRNRESNAAALAAISGTKPRMNKWDTAGAGQTSHQNLRTRAIRVNMRDFHAVFAANPRNRRSALLHKLALSTPPTDLSL